MLLQTLHTLYHHGKFAKLFVTVSVGMTLAPVVEFIRLYALPDSKLIATIFTMVALDTLLGVWCGWKQKAVSSKRFAPVLSKVTGYLVLLFAAHLLAKSGVDGKASVMLEWLLTGTYSAILVREFISLVEKLAILGLFVPKWLVKRLQQFDETGTYTGGENNG